MRLSESMALPSASVLTDPAMDPTTAQFGCIQRLNDHICRLTMLVVGSDQPHHNVPLVETALKGV